MSHGHNQLRARKSAAEARSRAPKAAGDTLNPQPRKHSTHTRSKMPTTLRYELENALVGLCDVWFEDIKPHLVRNNIKLHVEGAEGGSDGRLPVGEPGCPHLDPGAASDRQRRRTASSVGCSSTPPIASKAPYPKPRTRPPPNSHPHPRLTQTHQTLKCPNDNKSHVTCGEIKPPPPPPSTARRSSIGDIKNCSSKESPSANQSLKYCNNSSKEEFTSSKLSSTHQSASGYKIPKRRKTASCGTAPKSRLSPYFVHDQSIVANHIAGRGLPSSPITRCEPEASKKLLNTDQARSKSAQCPATFYSIMKNLSKVAKIESTASSSNMIETRKQCGTQSVKKSVAIQTICRRSTSKQIATSEKPVPSKQPRSSQTLVSSPRGPRQQPLWPQSNTLSLHMPEITQTTNMPRIENAMNFLDQSRCSKRKVYYSYMQRKFEQTLIITEVPPKTNVPPITDVKTSTETPGISPTTPPKKNEALVQNVNKIRPWR